jgi:peptidoglycan hydrolase-like protein with peptidoglycan-binding domain
VTPGAAAAAVLLAAATTGALVAMSSADDAAPRQEPPATTAEVERGDLSAAVSLDGTLTHRARPDGSPYAAINRAGGVYTELPEAGDEVGCGDVLHRVDDEPVLLLCGTVPAYRDLDVGDTGRDVRQLNRNLRALGLGAGLGAYRFTTRTQRALRRLQRAAGMEQTGSLGLGDAVVLPGPARIAKVTGRLGGSARPGAVVAEATSRTLHVRVELGASQQAAVRRGDRAQVTLPGNRTASGTVDRLGTVAQAPAGRDDDAAAATIPASIRLDDPGEARGLDRAPVRVQITTDGVEDALSVPVTALLGRPGGGFAVEVVRDGGRRALVAVRLGLFDTAGGRVEVEGDLAEGDPVVVPSP